MQCPKCQNKMEKIFVKSGIVDRCSHCFGLWFDANEDMETASLAAHIDIGNGKLGASFNHITKINCPVCENTQLEHHTDAKQTHIEYESCPRCAGRFFDAGEFRDIAEYTLSDIVKKLLKSART